ncbi:MAG: hypothetical protein ACYC91_11215 [Solirubrobacteraceae bacterium]
MRRLILLAVTAAMLAIPASGWAAGSRVTAAPRSADSALDGVALPIVAATSPDVPPPGFTSTASQAIAAAEHDSRLVALHRRIHPLFVQAFIWARVHWWINVFRGNRTVAEVDVSPSGRVTAVWTGRLALTVYGRGHYSPLFDSWYVVVPFCLLFLLPFLDVRRLRRLVHLDALVLLSFIGSYWFFDHTHLETAVWLAYPPMLYLLARMAAIGLGRARPGALSSLMSTRTLWIGLAVLLVARVALSFISAEVTDVGYASVLGAHRITHGQALYFNDPGHGDTYGPIAYLAYVPFELLFPWKGHWDYLASAHVASIVFDLVTVAGLVLLGRQLAPGREGRRLGLTLGWIWAACPFTLLGLVGHTNDGLVAMLSVLSLLVFRSPMARGAVLGLAAAAKFSPGALLPLFAGPRRPGWRGMVACGLAFTLVVVFAVAMYLPAGGLSEFYQRTLGYQLTRPDVFSPWALHPSLAPIKTVLEGLAIAFAAGLAFRPRRRSLVQVCALAAAVTIALQLPAVHWFYYYVIWFMPFVAVALVAGRRTGQPASAEIAQPGARRLGVAAGRLPANEDPVLVG